MRILSLKLNFAMMKYRVFRRYSPLAGTWYIIQKRTLFVWHTLNISFANLHSANEYLTNEVKFRDEICETPLEWNKKKQRFYEKYPCKTNLIRVK